MQISSTNFTHENKIPTKYAYEEENISPELSWRDAPEGTKTFALILDDPDAPNCTWVHWVIYNIPSNINNLKEGIAAVERLDNGTLQGQNDYKELGYGGPCPPVGHGVHRYFFKLYALDKELDLPANASKADLETAMQDHILAEAQMMGTFER